MSPKEKLQQKIDQLRAQHGEAQRTADALADKLDVLEQTMYDLFGAAEGPRRNHKPGEAPGKKADWKEVQAALWKALREAPPEGLTAQQLAAVVPRSYDTLKSWLWGQAKKKNIVRVSEGRYRAPKLEMIPDTDRSSERA